MFTFASSSRHRPTTSSAKTRVPCPFAPACSYTAAAIDTQLLQLHIDTVHHEPPVVHRSTRASSPSKHRRSHHSSSRHDAPAHSSSRRQHRHHRDGSSRHDRAERTERPERSERLERRHTRSKSLNNGPAKSETPPKLPPRRRPQELYDDDYVMCPEEGCGEQLMLMELQEHMDFHGAQRLAMEEQAAVTGESSGTGTENERRSRRSDKDRDRTRGKSSRRDRERRPHSRSVERGERRRSRAHGVEDREADKENRRPRDKERHRDGREREREMMREEPIGLSRNRSTRQPKGYNWMEKAALKFVAAVEGPKHMKGVAYEMPAEVLSSSRRREPSPADVVRPTRHKLSRSLSVSAPKSSKKGNNGLGPYANEDRMPDWLYNELERGGRTVKRRIVDSVTGRPTTITEVSNEVSGLISAISLLSENDPYVSKAWVCHPAAKHVGKQIAREGGFCGYRNIQMLISYIQAAYPKGTHPFGGRIPTILQLQDWIEEGWDKGINAIGREETGGIRGTRKYIGTSEAHTLFVSLSIPCRGRAFGKQEGYETQHQLLEFVESYFSAAPPIPSPHPTSKVVHTNKAPIYFQHSGHSMTIVGLERYADGSAGLLVFDPFFTPVDAMKEVIGRDRLRSRMRPETLLKLHRRGMDYLRKYREFEVVVLET